MHINTEHDTLLADFSRIVALQEQDWTLLFSRKARIANPWYRWCGWVCMCYFKSSLNIYFTVQVEVLAVQGEEGQMSTSSTLAETTLPAMMTDQLEGKLSGA